MESWERLQDLWVNSVELRYRIAKGNCKQFFEYFKDPTLYPSEMLLLHDISKISSLLNIKI